MSNIKVSVIIPVYNVEPYLKECLDSVINQTLKEIEIICIDDCSTDNSYKILEEYAKKDDRIIVLKNEKNIGSGPTRNVGIKKAKGEYISFIDPDDYISYDFLETLYNTAKKYNSDITTTLNVYHDDNGHIYEKSMNINKFLSKKEKKNPKLYLEGETNASILDLKDDTKEYIYITLTNKLHRRTFLISNNLFYMDIHSGADDEDYFNRIMLNNPKCSYNHKGIYYHRKREGSLMNTYERNLDYLICCIELMQNSIDYCKKYFPEYINIINNRVINFIISRFNSCICKKSFYKHVYNFIKNMNINIDNLDNNQLLFLIITSNENYEQFLLNKYILDKIKDMEYMYNNINSKVIFFGIYNMYDKIVVYFFGIKITIKKIMRNNYEKY